MICDYCGDAHASYIVCAPMAKAYHLNTFIRVTSPPSPPLRDAGEELPLYELMCEHLDAARRWRELVAGYEADGAQRLASSMRAFVVKECIHAVAIHKLLTERHHKREKVTLARAVLRSILGV